MYFIISELLSFVVEFYCSRKSALGTCKRFYKAITAV